MESFERSTDLDLQNSNKTNDLGVREIHAIRALKNIDKTNPELLSTGSALNGLGFKIYSCFKYFYK